MITNQIYNVLFLKTKGFCLPLQWKATVFIDLAVLLFRSVVVVLFLRLITFILIFLVLKHTLLYLYVSVRHGLYGGGRGGGGPCLDREVHPRSRVNVSERLYNEKKVDLFTQANSANACSDCLAS